MRFGILGNSTFAERLAQGFTEAGHTCELAASLPKSMLPIASGGLGPRFGNGFRCPGGGRGGCWAA